MKPISTACLLAIIVSMAGMLSSIAAQEPQLRQRQITSGPHLHRKETEEAVSARVRRFITHLFVGISLGPPEIVLGVDPEPDEDEHSQEELYREESEDQCPGQERYKVLYQEVPGIWSTNLGDFGIDELDKDFERSFLVEPNHTILDNGVMFNVELVPDARPEDLYKPRLSQEEILAAVEEEAKKFYNVRATSRAAIGKDRISTVEAELVEAMSRVKTTTKEEEEGSGVIFASGQGFLAACMTAFAYHLPLTLTPDDIWIVITNGFARHINRYAEELRYNFVNHTGQQEITIREDSMRKGNSPPEQWEELIFPKFSYAIAQAVGNTTSSNIHNILAGRKFSTSTAASNAASEITLMATMKNYFKFKMETMCGIPNIRLEGTREDWDSLRNRTKDLAQFMMQNHSHGDLWINNIVVPIIDEFVKSYDNDINYCFWQNMIKFRTTGDGSGSYDFLSGWLSTLFPYLSDLDSKEIPNPYLRPWQESASALQLGPKPSEIPIQISSVAVEWRYFEETYNIHFHAGFRGIHQGLDGTVRPIIGWYVTEDPVA